MSLSDTLATTDDIETFLNVTFSNDQLDQAELLLDLAIGEIEGYLGRPVGPTEFTEEALLDSDGRIFLNNTPVIDVSSVTLEGTELDADWYEVTKWGIQNVSAWAPAYDPILINSDWAGQDRVVVEYTAGIINRAINSLLIQGVARKMIESGAGSSTTVTTDVGSVDMPANVKRIKVEDFEIEAETNSTTTRSMYASSAGVLSIFPSELDFLSIKKYRKVRTG